MNKKLYLALQALQLIQFVGVQILNPEIDMISEMKICLLLGITETAAAKAVDLATKCNMTSPHPAHRLGILKTGWGYY